MEGALKLNEKLANLIEDLGGKALRIETVDGKVVVSEELKQNPALEAAPETEPTKKEPKPEHEPEPEEPKPEPTPQPEEPTKCQKEPVQEETPEKPTEVAAAEIEASEKFPEEPAQEATVVEDKIEEKEKVKKVKLAKKL